MRESTRERERVVDERESEMNVENERQRQRASEGMRGGG